MQNYPVRPVDDECSTTDSDVWRLSLWSSAKRKDTSGECVCGGGGGEEGGLHNLRNTSDIDLKI